MRNFYSGISNDKTQFLINMNWYISRFIILIQSRKKKSMTVMEIY